MQAMPIAVGEIRQDRLLLRRELAQVLRLAWVLRLAGMLWLSGML